MTKKEDVKRLIEVATGKRKAELKIENAKVIDVFNKEVFSSSVVIDNGFIVSFSDKIEAEKIFDANGEYMIPGFIDAHCHIESSHLSPSAFSDTIVPFGTTTVIADPHEICNVSGTKGLDYLIEGSKDLPLSIFLMLPSCVPATPFEHAGATLLAKDFEPYIKKENVLGLGELMNAVGVINGDESILDKLELIYREKKVCDGHAPGLKGEALDAYIAAKTIADHECATVEEMREKIRRGMYVMLRQGTVCRNVKTLIKGVDDKNYSRCVFCTDDRQPETIKEDGHLNHGVNIAIKEGVDPIIAISMATLNASVLFNLDDRGAISPGRRADFFFSKSLDKIEATRVFSGGKLVAEDKRILSSSHKKSSLSLTKSISIKDGYEEKLRLRLKSDNVNVIEIVPGEVITRKGKAKVRRDEEGFWVYTQGEDVLKLSVLERHHNTGYVSSALIKGYGLKTGAVATTIAHDSHNVIVVGNNDKDIIAAVEEIKRIGGGITIVKDGKVLMSHVLELGGLMTDSTGDEVASCIKEMKKIAYEELGVSRKVDPFMTLSFMALPVIPDLKITDSGLFDVTKFTFIPVEVE